MLRVPARPGRTSTAGIVPRAGLVASAITTVCCLGLSTAVSLASTLGATFLTQDSSLKPLLALSLAMTVGGSLITYRHHRSLVPLLLTVGASLWIYAALYGPLDHGIGVTRLAGGPAHGHAEHGHAMHDAMNADPGSHGGLNPTLLVWAGLAALLAAQLWDARRLRHCRAPRQHVSGKRP